MTRDRKYLEEICGKCGNTYGYHYGGCSSTLENACPVKEKENGNTIYDWSGARFVTTGVYQNELTEVLGL